MSAAQEGGDSPRHRTNKEGSGESLNPTHRRHIQDLALEHQEAGGLQFGDSTMITLGFPREGQHPDISQLLGVSGVDVVERAMDLPQDHPERQRLDQALRERMTMTVEMAETISELSGPNTESDAALSIGLMMKVALSDNVTVVINGGYAGSRPYHLTLVGDRFYRVTADESETGLIAERDGGAVLELRFQEEVNQRYLDATPPLSDLAKAQGLTGATLREALPQLAQVFGEHAGGFLVGLQAQIGEVARASHFSVDIPRDDGPGTVQLRLYPDADYKLHRIDIVAI